MPRREATTVFTGSFPDYFMRCLTSEEVLCFNLLSHCAIETSKASTQTSFNTIPPAQATLDVQESALLSEWSSASRSNHVRAFSIRCASIFTYLFASLTLCSPAQHIDATYRCHSFQCHTLRDSQQHTEKHPNKHYSTLSRTTAAARYLTALSDAQGARDPSRQARDDWCGPYLHSIVEDV